MRENVAVQDELPRVIDKAASHPEVARNGNCLAVLVGIVPGSRDRKRIPPDKVFLWRVAWFPCRGIVGVGIARILWIFGRGALRLKHLGDLKWIHVDVERMFLG